MKENPSRLPDPSSERKISPIVGRGARAARSRINKRRPIVEEYEAFEDDPEDHLEEGFLEGTRRNPMAMRKESNAKGSGSRSSRTRKPVETQSPRGVLQTAETSQSGENTMEPGDSSQSSHASHSDSVQPPPKVSPARKSRKSKSSTHDLAPEEPTPSLEDAEQPSVKFDYASQWGMAVVFFQKIHVKHPRILAAAAVFLLLLTGFLFGRLQPGTSSLEEQRATVKPSPQLVKELNEALALIEGGESSKAFQKIQNLSDKHPDVSSLDYLAALAALQAGDMKTAQEKATLSITKNQKISDSLVLLSMTESGAGTGGKSSLRDPKIVRESLLREAVNADVANPFPMIELASFLRSQKRDEEALDLLRAANARLHPIDTHVVVQTSIELMKLQQTPDDELPAARAEGSITEIFSSVYISLRRKDYNQAAIALEKGRHQTTPDLFAYLINDPVFKPFHSEPVMTRAL